MSATRSTVQAVPDALIFRKLPALWLLVTLTEPQPLAGETRIMVRPSGLEPFSTFAQLPTETAPPPGFPPHCVVRTTAPAHLPPAHVMATLAPLLEDPALKEIVLSPGPAPRPPGRGGAEGRLSSLPRGRTSAEPRCPPPRYSPCWRRSSSSRMNSPRAGNSRSWEAMSDRRLPHPWLVFAVALLLPGCGQVMNRQPQRGLIFLFFMLLLGGFTLVTADPQASRWSANSPVACSSMPWLFSTPTAPPACAGRFVGTTSTGEEARPADLLPIGSRMRSEKPAPYEEQKPGRR